MSVLEQDTNLTLIIYDFGIVKNIIERVNNENFENEWLEVARSYHAKFEVRKEKDFLNVTEISALGFNGLQKVCEFFEIDLEKL